ERALRAILVPLGLCAALATVPTVGSASIGLGGGVSAKPADGTPNGARGARDKLLQVGGTMYAAGALGSVSPRPESAPAGTFPGKLRAVNPASGANTGYLNLSIGAIHPTTGPALEPHQGPRRRRQGPLRHLPGPVGRQRHQPHRRGHPPHPPV